jgi:hypothetical protein
MSEWLLQTLHVAQRGNNVTVDDIDDKRKVTASHKRGSAAQNGCGWRHQKAKKVNPFDQTGNS